MSASYLAQIQRVIDLAKASAPISTPTTIVLPPSLPPPIPAATALHEFPPPEPEAPISSANPFRFVPVAVVSPTASSSSKNTAAAAAAAASNSASSAFAADYSRIRLEQLAEANAAAIIAAKTRRLESEQKESEKRVLARAAGNVMKRMHRSRGGPIQLDADVEIIEDSPADAPIVVRGDDAEHVDDDDIHDAPIPFAASTVRPRDIQSGRRGSSNSSSSSVKHRVLNGLSRPSSSSTSTATLTSSSSSAAAAAVAASRSRWIGKTSDAASMEAARAKRLAAATAEAIRREGIVAMQQAEARAAKLDLMNLKPTTSQSRTTLPHRPAPAAASKFKSASSSAPTPAPSNMRPFSLVPPQMKSQPKSAVLNLNSSSAATHKRHASHSDEEDSDGDDPAAAARASLRGAKRKRASDGRDEEKDDGQRDTKVRKKSSTSLRMELPSAMDRLGSSQLLTPVRPTAAGSSSSSSTPSSFVTNSTKSSSASSLFPTSIVGGVADASSSQILPVIPLPPSLTSQCALTIPLRQTFVTAFLRLALRAHPKQFDADQLHPSLPANALLLRCEWQIVEHILRTASKNMQVTRYKEVTHRVLTLMTMRKDVVYVAQCIAQKPDLADVNLAAELQATK